MSTRVLSGDESHRITEKLDGGPSVSLGLKIVCALKIVVDVLAILGGLLGAYGGFMGPLAWVTVGLAVVDLYVVYGLLKLELWGWKWAVALGAFNVLIALWPPESSLGLLGAGVVALVTLYVYSKKSVYEAVAR